MFGMKLLRPAVFALLLATAAPIGPAFAHGGEDHGEQPPPTLSTATKETGFGGEGAAFQVVLLPRDGRTLAYVAEVDTNEPVAQATLQAEASAWQGEARPGTAPGVYDFAWAPAPGERVDVTLVISAGGRDDLILIEGVAGATASPPPAPAATGKRAWLPWAGGGVLSLLLIGTLIGARTQGLRIAAALTLAGVLAAAAGQALAHGGEDHGDGPQSAPQTAAGTALAMPKATQFLLGIKTVRVEPKQAAESIRLVGRVVPDPGGYARVQPSQSARVLADPNFPIPVAGQPVRKGQVLAVLEPTLTNVERSDKRGALYKVESEIAVLERQLARWRQLEGVVAPKEVEAARIQIEQLRKERGQLAGTALGRELVTAPVDGLVTDVHLVPGEVVSAETVLVEIVDLARLRVEAVLYDFRAAGSIAGGTAITNFLPEEVFPLKLLGVSPRINPEDQGIHLLFSVEQTRGLLRLGMPVDVFAETGATRLRVAVPRDAVTDLGGRPVVFIRTAPERFEPRPVKVERLVGPWAEIAHGIDAGDKVVLQGVAQLKAVR